MNAFKLQGSRRFFHQVDCNVRKIVASKWNRFLLGPRANPWLDTRETRVQMMTKAAGIL